MVQSKQNYVEYNLKRKIGFTEYTILNLILSVFQCGSIFHYFKVIIMSSTHYYHRHAECQHFHQNETVFLKVIHIDLTTKGNHRLDRANSRS